MALRIQIAKFKLHQYLLRANSPYLMFTKLSHYTVYLLCVSRLMCTFFSCI